MTYCIYNFYNLKLTTRQNNHYLFVYKTKKLIFYFKIYFLIKFLEILFLCVFWVKKNHIRNIYCDFYNDNFLIISIFKTNKLIFFSTRRDIYNLFYNFCFHRIWTFVMGRKRWKHKNTTRIQKKKKRRKKDTKEKI